MATYTLIPKEEIPALHFIHNEILTDDFDIDQRKKNLYKAMIAGNTYKQKVRILFESAEGPQQVETTVWATADNNILLKGGIHIPIHCIRSVSF